VVVREATTSFSLLTLSHPHHQKSYVALHGTTCVSSDVCQCRACLGGLRLWLHERLQAEPSQTVKPASTPGVKPPPEPLVASTHEAEPRKCGSIRLRLVLDCLALMDAVSRWRPAHLWNGLQRPLGGRRGRSGEGRHGGEGAAGAPPSRSSAPPWRPRSRRCRIEGGGEWTGRASPRVTN
jgi:hypothetical protein